MTDAAYDLLQSTYPPLINQVSHGVSPTRREEQQQDRSYPTFNFDPVATDQPSDETSAEPSNEDRQKRPIAFHSPNPLVYGSKDSKKIYHSHESAGDTDPGLGTASFSFRKDIGYVCVVCSRVCPKPSEHRTLQGGAGCVDFSLEYKSMHSWRELEGEGMQIHRDQAEEEKRDPVEATLASQAPQATTPEADRNPLLGAGGERRLGKGKEPVREENENPLGSIGPHEAAFIMKSNHRAMLEVEKELKEGSGSLF